MTSTETPRRSRTPWIAAAAAVAAAVVAVAIAIPALTGDETPTTTTAAAAPLQLDAGQGDGMAMCIAFSVDILRDMETAFEATVTAVDGEHVTLAVDHWFKGGDATTVDVFAPDGLQALIGGIDFVEGDQYLITATNGVVNYCGFSGPETPEYRTAFEEAFAG